MATYTLISGSNITSSTAGVTFSSIPQGYSDLVLRITARVGTSGTTAWLQMRFNNSSSGYYEVYGYSNAGSQGFGAVGPQTSIGASGWIQATAGGATANVFSVAEIYVPNYTENVSANQIAGILSTRNGASASTDGGNTMATGVWSTVTAISTIYVFASSNFQAGSKIYLYGIKNT